jgi:hypothetical protein
VTHPVPPAGSSPAAKRVTGLRRFAAPPPRTAAEPERCALCGTEVAEGHRHLVDTKDRSIACACTACSLFFMHECAAGRRAQPSSEDSVSGRYRTVPDRVLLEPGTPLTDAEWAALAIPVGTAFFFHNSALGQVVASYPSSAGVTECELDLSAWDEVAAAHPLLRALTPDVEAIIVTGTQPRETFLVPIDVCYGLAGALRLNWRGFDGGAEVRQIFTALVTDLRRRARTLQPTSDGRA